MPLDDSYIRLAHAIVVQAAKDYDAELDWFRQNDVKNMNKLIDMLEDNEDVQNVWHNWQQD